MITNGLPKLPKSKISCALTGAGRHCRTFTLCLFSVSLLGACGTFNRDDNNRVEDRDFNNRFYLGGGLLVSKLEPDADQSSVYSVAETQSAGGSFLVGYDLTNRFSIEGHLASLGAAKMNPSGEIGYSVGGLSALVYGLNDEDDRQRRTGFSIYGRGGVGYMENSATDNIPYERLNDFHVLIGAGLEYGFESGVGVRAEIVSEDTDAQYAQLGVLYRFGDSENRRTVERTYAEPAPEIVSVPEPTVQQPAIVVADRDQDGVQDQFDQCLNTGPSTPVNSVGCDYFNGVIEGVNFESGSDLLTSQARTILSEVSTTLARFPDIRVSIEAHTDNQGSAPANLNLSKRRALAVARFLVSEGIVPGRLKPMAYGEGRPRASNQSSEGRAMNRRVEFKVIP